MIVAKRSARRNKNTSFKDWINIELIFKYQKYTIYDRVNFTKQKYVKIFVNADYERDFNARRSSLKFLMMIDFSNFSW